MINYWRYQGLHYANENCHQIESLQVLEAGSASTKRIFLTSEAQKGPTREGRRSRARSLPRRELRYGKSRRRLSRFLRQENIRAPRRCWVSTLSACPKEDATGLEMDGFFPQL